MSGNSDTSATRALKVGGFTVLAIAALITCAAATVRGEAPLTSQFVQDWVDWPRTTPAWATVFGVGAVLLLASIIGAIMALFSGGSKTEKGRPTKSSRNSRLDDSSTALSIPASETLAAARGSLKFDTQTLSTPAADSVTIEPVAAAMPATEPFALDAVEPPSLEIHSLEPAIFGHHADADLVEPAGRFDPDAALSDTHGLQVATGAQVIPIRPEIQLPPEVIAAAEPALSRDPVEAALLADASATPRAAPPSDMNAVISSAMRFIEAPADEAVAVERIEGPVETADASNGFHEVAASFEPVDDQTKIRQAVQMALSVWPDATRAIAADELNVRVAYLFHDKAAQSALAFNQIASGDLTAAATTLQGQADNLNAAGSRGEAAEVWRVIGALNMGRDDPKALVAYEKVSELDPSDANIHVYLARRYQMAGETAKQLPVLTRALAVVGDPATRLELLTPYADLKLKGGDIQAAGDAFEELSRLHETRTYLKPDDVPARSAQAISLAKLGQVREMQGAFDQAGQSYKKAHGIFADLSAMKPDHAGLRNMAENTQRDAQRLNA